MIEYILTAFITSLIGLLGSFFILKKMKNEAIDEVFGYFESEDGLKFIYKMGVVAGNGLKQGVGLPNKGGKFKMDDLISGAVSGFAQNFLAKSANRVGSNPALNPVQNPNPRGNTNPPTM